MSLFSHISKTARRTLCGVLICAALLVSYVPSTVPKAEALGGGGGPVTVVGGNGTVQETISAGANTIVAGIQDAFFIKEFTLDGIAYGLAKMILRSMTQSILNWINSGFQGSPAFITDLKQFMLDRVDQAVGEFIYNDPALNFLCSPFQLDVRIALATSYQESTREGLGAKAQCTLSDVTDNVEGFLNGAFDEGGWEGMFEMTQNPVNTPTGAKLAAETEMYARIVDEQGRAIKELDWGDGFMSFKVCDDTQNQSNCSITTPGRVIADQINKSLGAGQDALITADEIDEIISALFAQLAQQALTSLGGLRGLSSSGGFDDPTGSTTRSYLDAMGSQPEGSSGVNPFTRAIENEQRNTTLQRQAITNINNAEARLDAAIAAHGSCITVDLPDALIETRDLALIRVARNTASIAEMTTDSTEFTATATTAERRLELVNELMAKQRDGRYTSLTENTLLDVNVRYTLQDTINTFIRSLNSNISRCNDDDD